MLRRRVLCGPHAQGNVQLAQTTPRAYLDWRVFCCTWQTLLDFLEHQLNANAPDAFHLKEELSGVQASASEAGGIRAVGPNSFRGAPSDLWRWRFLWPGSFASVSLVIYCMVGR